MDHRPIMDGTARDPISLVMRVALAMAAIPYRAGVAIRNRRFDSGKTPIQPAGVPVISIGNLTTGGTGKTPVVCDLAKRLRDQGFRVAIVSRGYGRGDSGSNDEAMELHDRLPDVPHVQDPDRVEAARVAVEELAAEVILMDDGFQHRHLHRDLDIVVVDATCPFGYGRLLPRGLLREPVRSIRRADLAILTRADQVDADTIDEIQTTLHRHHPTLPILVSNHRPHQLRSHPDQFENIESLNGCHVATVCGVGNPSAFETTVRECGATIIDSFHLPDHDAFDRETMQRVRQWLGTLSDIDRVVCTHKDLVKLATDRLAGIPLAAIEIELAISDPDGSLEKALDAIVTPHA